MIGAPDGLGMWIAFEGSITPGNKAADLARAIEVCRRTGARWVALRAGAGSVPDHDLSDASIVAFDSAGLDVYLWPFCYAASLEGELAILRKWRGLSREGSAYRGGPGGAPRVRGVILNAEFEWMKNATDAQALELVARCRSLGYDFVGHAPPDYAGARGDGALHVLDGVCDAIFPQVYAWEHEDSGHVHHLRNVLLGTLDKRTGARAGGYAQRGHTLDRVWPILCSYRPITRGGRPTPALPREAELVAGDIVDGLDFLEELGGCRAPSLYSIDAWSFACRAGVGAAVLEALAERAQRRPTTEPGLTLTPSSSSPATSIADEVHRDIQRRDGEDE